MSTEDRILRLENAMSTLVEMLAEQQRQTAEQQRQTAEQQRLNAEQQRLNAEQQRLNAEQQRRTARLEESFVALIDLLGRHEERLDELRDGADELRAAQAQSERKIATLADAQMHTERKLDALIDIVSEQRNGQG
jgi:chromosome segregation ATPase